ncbi:YggT family protein [Aliikangiella coralliicola]|uniref:YggT family protein n=1 Tax=Aliikangiella coralliicola TaxID=2592383 RepID=A0A545U788_9GAMM|nr:YggT family protein [Aliikangiella coralliicola]TQV85339.1 YggT family protein [Aliikangiella coralliicola]
MNPFAQLISMLIGLYVSAILLRFFLQYFRADYYNPVSQFIIKITDPLVKPIRRVVPGFGGIDLSTLILAWLVIIVKYLFIQFISSGIGNLNIAALLLYSVINVFESAIGLYIFLIIVRAIASWFMQPGQYNPVLAIFGQLTEPLLAKVREKLPPTGGFDLSPMLVLIVLFFINSSISYYLYPLIAKLTS